MVFFFPKEEIATYFNRPFKVESVSLGYLNDLLVEITGQGVDIPQEQKKISDQEKLRIYNNMLSIMAHTPQDKKSWEILWIAYQLLRWVVFSFDNDSEYRKQTEATLSKKILAIKTGPFNKVQLEQLAKDALAIAQPKIALQVYNQILTQEPNQPATFFANMAMIAQQGGVFKNAGNLYIQAFIHAKQHNLKEKYFTLSLSSLLAGSEHEAVAKTLRTYGDLFSNNKEILLFMSKSALSANQPQLAKKYIDQLMHQQKNFKHHEKK